LLHLFMLLLVNFNGNLNNRISALIKKRRFNQIVCIS
jgi:hypothetical protein